MAGPEPPPFIRPARLRTSNPACGEVPLWHFAQLASSKGETESSNGMGFVDWAEPARVQTSDTTPTTKPGICDRRIPLSLSGLYQKASIHVNPHPAKDGERMRTRARAIRLWIPRGDDESPVLCRPVCLFDPGVGFHLLLCKFTFT